MKCDSDLYINMQVTDGWPTFSVPGADRAPDVCKVIPALKELPSFSPQPETFPKSHYTMRKSTGQ